MLQYIINVSIIWLACLLLFEALLRKETFHQYNRIYLLASLAAGLLSLTINLNKLIASENPALRQPTEHVYEIKKAFAVSATPSPSVNNELNLELVLWFVYLAGVLTGIALLLLEVIQLVRLYATGIKTKDSGCRIIETSKVHSPFSLFKIIFIRSKEDYDQLQWSLLLAHEMEHSRLLHTMDNIALIILRIVFWFHPLPHIYYKRLMMVHEFQADGVGTTNVADYGNFLLDQGLLQGAPTITHSFNYSPIKNRIAMLTGTRSPRAKLVKYLSVLPLTFFLILFCTQTSFSGERTRKGNKIYYKGNEIELKGYPQMDVEVEDPVTLKFRTVTMKRDSTILNFNGKPVYVFQELFAQGDINTADAAEFIGPEGSFDKYLFTNLQADLNRLADGRYSLDIDRVVIDEKGNLAYYEVGGINNSHRTKKENRAMIIDEVKNTIDNKLARLLDDKVKFKPAVKEGKPVIVRYYPNISGGPLDIVVKNHVATLKPYSDQ